MLIGPHHCPETFINFLTPPKTLGTVIFDVIVHGLVDLPESGHAPNKD